MATDAVLVEALEQATKGPADLGLVHKTVQERLRYFNDKMKVDLVWATDARGRVIARAGLDEKGNFKLDVPEGKYTLKVFWHDHWALTQALEVTGHANEVTVQLPATPPATATAGAKP